jgi:deazaflavin-dependent oxidoreductase (nitroreductase family)
MSAYSERIVTEFRANRGTLTTGNFARNIILVHHVGVADGVERVAPLYAQAYDEGWTVVAANSGLDEHPKWLPDFMANSGIVVEFPDDDNDVGKAVVDVSEVPDGDWDDEWAAFLHRAPGFADYQSTTERRLPILKLRRRP